MIAIAARLRVRAQEPTLPWLAKGVLHCIAHEIEEELEAPHEGLPPYILNDPTTEQQARDLLKRIGVGNVHMYHSGDLAELANLIQRDNESKKENT